MGGWAEDAEKGETVETDLPWYRNGSDVPGLAKATLAPSELGGDGWTIAGGKCNVPQYPCEQGNKYSTADNWRASDTWHGSMGPGSSVLGKPPEVSHRAMLRLPKSSSIDEQSLDVGRRVNQRMLLNRVTTGDK